MSIFNEIVLKMFRMQMLTSQQQQQKTENVEKKTFDNEIDDEKIIIKNSKFAKTLKIFFVNRSIVIFKNKKTTKKFITKKKTGNDIINEKKL